MHGDEQAGKPKPGPMDEEDPEVLEIMKAAIAKRRGYADFFQWPDQQVEEWGILETFAEAVAGDSVLRITDAQPSPKDPPDAWANSAVDGRITIELTELVVGDAIRAQRRSPEPLWRLWTRDQFRDALRQIVRRNDSATPSAAAYQGYWLIVHTAEPALTQQNVRSYLTDFAVGPCKLVTRCFILMSYSPGIKGYPVFEVPVQREPQGTP